VETIFGVIDHIDHQQIPISQTFDERLEQVVKYDADGMYAFHVTEHHFTDHGLASSPIAFLAAAARLTKKIKLIPTVLVMPTYHPLRLAEELCMLDQLSHGRVEYGVGRGIVPHELSLFGINPHEAGDIAEEGLEVLRLALTKDQVTHRGGYYKFFGVPMVLKMFQQKHPPLWITSAKLEAAQAAGSAGDNFMSLLGPTAAKTYSDAFFRGWGKPRNSPDVPKFGLTRHIYIAEDQAHAVERGEFGFSGWFSNHSAIWKRFDRARGYGDDSHYRKSQAMIFGTPEFVRAEIERHIAESGCNYFVPRFAFGDLPQEEVLRSYELFRREVLPHFKSGSSAIDTKAA
jgi:alkanesulfonate monooxygenase SsuD/methylene tetrahydromethanopterin reductase-like flavin-dependent oxidoreductase (luciferase family)